MPTIDAMTGPETQLLPNSEFVNGPAYVDFDTVAFIGRSGGYLNNYSEYVGGELLSGPEIVNLVAHHFSVGPRLLLALIELDTGWVTNPNPGGQAFSHRWLSRAADDLNKGYYDWRGRGVTLLKWGDGYCHSLCAESQRGTAGLQYYFSR